MKSTLQEPASLTNVNISEESDNKAILKVPESTSIKPNSPLQFKNTTPFLSKPKILFVSDSVTRPTNLRALDY